MPSRTNDVSEFNLRTASIFRIPDSGDTSDEPCGEGARRISNAGLLIDLGAHNARSNPANGLAHFIRHSLSLRGRLAAGARPGPG